MPLEVATWVGDLDASNPVGATDSRSQADDHHRLVKSVLKNTFPNATKAFRFPTAEVKSGNYTILSSDMNKLIVADASGGGFNLTLPTLVAGDQGWKVGVVKSSAANAVTVVGTINGAANYIINSQYGIITFQWSGSAWFSSQSPDLAALEALTGTGTPRRTAVDTWVLADDVVAIAFVIEGPGGTVIPTGIKGDLIIPFACTILEWVLLADQVGSLVMDIWKDVYANYPPTVADSITAAAKPTITTANKANSTVLTGWTTIIAANDTLRFNVDSCSTITRATLTLRVRKTY
jgi:hypothetical protein